LPAKGLGPFGLLFRAVLPRDGVKKRVAGLEGRTPGYNSAAAETVFDAGLYSLLPVDISIVRQKGEIMRNRLEKYF
jgi:hypothetical protein